MGAFTDSVISLSRLMAIEIHSKSVLDLARYALSLVDRSQSHHSLGSFLSLSPVSDKHGR